MNKYKGYISTAFEFSSTPEDVQDVAIEALRVTLLSNLVEHGDSGISIIEVEDEN